MTQETILLKLGGSLITDKSQPGTARYELIERIAADLATTLYNRTEIRLVVGHGSGSFGHIPASVFGTRLGVRSQEEWLGFSTVWHQASKLNRIVVDALRHDGIPAVAFPPSAASLANNGKIEKWDTTSIKSALENGLVPVVFGDVVFDRSLGGSIVSTEDVFVFLAPDLQPSRILIAGIEEGVWEDYPACTSLLKTITPKSFKKLTSPISGSVHTDVTGGMETKVAEMLQLAQSLHGLQIRIFNGSRPGAISEVLEGKNLGTLVHA